MAGGMMQEEDVNAAVRRQASNALTQIDPVLAAKHGREAPRVATTDLFDSVCFYD
jgi:hypothetical protein